MDNYTKQLEQRVTQLETEIYEQNTDIKYLEEKYIASGFRKIIRELAADLNYINKWGESGSPKQQGKYQIVVQNAKRLNKLYKKKINYINSCKENNKLDEINDLIVSEYFYSKRDTEEASKEIDTLLESIYKKYDIQ